MFLQKAQSVVWTYGNVLDIPDDSLSLLAEDIDQSFVNSVGESGIFLQAQPFY